MSFHVCVGLSLLLGLAALLTGCTKGSAVQARTSNKGHKIPVQVAHVNRQEIDRRVEAVGTLFAFQEVTVSSETEGRVDQVLVDLGDRVTKGQKLAVIHPEEAQYNLAQQEAQMRQAMDRLGLQKETDRVTDINQVPDVVKAAADLKEAEQHYKRVRELVAQQVASAQDLDQAESRYHALRATLDLTRMQVANLISAVSQYKAQVDLARKRLRDTSLVAPFDGAIRQKLVDIGQYVKPQTPMFGLVDVDPLRLRAEVPEKMAPWVKVGNIVELQVEAHPGRTFTGKVWRMSPSVDEQKRTFAIEALIPNGENLLRPGFYVKAAIVTGKKEVVLTIPAQAVLYVYGTNKAFVIEGGKAWARELRLGERLKDDFEVVEGLRAEDQVAVGELERLDNGAPVQVQEK